MISNFPVSTASRYKRIEPKQIQAMGKIPKAAPNKADMTTSFTGMPYAPSATTNADASALEAAIQVGFLRTPSIKNKTNIGIAATRADIARLPPTGS